MFVGYMFAYRLFFSMHIASGGRYVESGLEVITFEFILKLKIKRNGWLLADTCPQATNHCALLYSSFITFMPGLGHCICFQTSFVRL